MKRILAALALLFFLAGCSPSEKTLERGLALRDRLLKAEQCSFTAQITADYGQELHQFTMAVQGDAGGDVVFQVLAPETISGISGNIRSQGGELTFDDAALFFPLLTDDQLTPVSAPWIFLKTLRSGCLTSAGMEDALLRLTIDDSYAQDAMTVDIWVDPEDRPIRAEILHDGRKILTLQVEDFRIS